MNVGRTHLEWDVTSPVGVGWRGPVLMPSLNINEGRPKKAC